MKIIGANITGSFILNNQDVTNTLQSSSVWSGSVATQINSLNAASASLNSATASLSSATASLYAATASLNSATASLNTFTASAATTGSNTFNGNQIVSGSLTVTGSITTPGTLTAQTLVVQTVTSSTVYSSGSNIFGNNISNTQVLTGSVYMTGSLNTVGNAYLGGDTYITGGNGLYVKGNNSQEIFITSNADSTYLFMEAYKTSSYIPDRATAEKYLDGYVMYDKVYFNGDSGSYMDYGFTAYPNKTEVYPQYRGAVELWLPTNNTTGSFSIRNYYNLSTNYLAKFQSNGRTLLNNATDNGINTLQVSGSIFATSLTGSLSGTATNATSASYAANSTNADTASFVTLAQTASFVTTSQTASFVTTAQTASFVTLAQTASFITTAQTASFVANAQSASNAVTAQTASFANSFTVANTLTAQTLVVQTITSSVDFVTGSTRFGSTGSNTHQFTGSVNINPSLYVANFLQSGSYPLSVAAYTEAYNPGINSYKSLYVPAGTAVQLSSQISNFTGSSAFLFDINAYSSSAATNVYFGGVAGPTGNGPANFVIGRRIAVSTWAESLRIDTTGNVGIGTSNPGSRLTVRGTDSNSMLYLGISGSSANGEAVGITFGSATYDKARIVAYNENSGNAAGYLTLWTGGSPGTTDVTERIRITSGGDVGIGTTSPAEKLEVSGSLKIGNLKIQNVNGGSVGFNRNTANGAIYNSGYAAFQINGAYSGANYLDFQNYNSSGTYVGGFVLNNGNIGMGTTGPNTKLQILGNSISVGTQNSYALGVGNSSGYDLTLGTDSSYAYIQSWTSKPLSINSQGNSVVFPNTSTNVSIGTATPSANGLTIYRDGGDRKIMLELNRPNSPGLKSAIQFTVGSSIMVGQIQHEYASDNYNHMSFSLRNPSGATIVPLWLQNSGNIGIGTTNPSKTLEVNGRMSTSAIVSGGLIAGNIASNMPSSPAYIPIFNMAETAGFSLTGFVNAASYTNFNISQIYIRKEYAGSTVNAGITGLYKLNCDFSIVNITYSGGTWIALRFTANPEIDVVWTGYLLNYAFNSDGSAQVWTSGVTLNSTYASY